MFRLIRFVVLAGVMAALPLIPARAEGAFNDIILTVEAALPGATLEAISRTVTRPLENELGGLFGIEAVISVSRAAKSTITLKFRTARRQDAVLAEVRDRLARSRDRLPPGMAAPRIAVPDPRDVPVAYMNVSSDIRTLLEISEIAERFVLQPLATVDGIAELRTHGLRKSMIAVRLDTPRFAAYGVSRDDVVRALQGAGFAAETIGPDEIAAVPAAGAPRTDIEALSMLVLKADGGAVTRLRDVAQVELSMRPTDVDVRANGRPAVAIEIFVAARFGLPEATRHVRDALPSVMPNLPAGMDTKILYACTRCAEPLRR